MNEKPIATSGFAARLEYVEADERAALHERAKSFGPYRAEIRHYLEVEFSSTEDFDGAPLDEHLAPQMLEWLDDNYDEISAEKGRKLRRSGAEVHVQIADWDEACGQVYARSALVRAYTLPVAADDDALRHALLHPGAPKTVFEQAVAREALLYDVALAPAAPADLLAELAERSADGENGSRVAFAVASEVREAALRNSYTLHGRLELVDPAGRVTENARPFLR